MWLEGVVTRNVGRPLDLKVYSLLISASQQVGL